VDYGILYSGYSAQKAGELFCGAAIFPPFGRKTQTRGFLKKTKKF
jgi:hypothetical protein